MLLEQIRQETHHYNMIIRMLLKGRLWVQRAKWSTSPNSVKSSDELLKEYYERMKSISNNTRAILDSCNKLIGIPNKKVNNTNLILVQELNYKIECYTMRLFKRAGGKIAYQIQDSLHFSGNNKELYDECHNRAVTKISNTK